MVLSKQIGVAISTQQQNSEVLPLGSLSYFCNTARNTQKTVPAPSRPDRSTWKIDPSHWPEVTRRVEQGESPRHVARAYEVSHETIRRVLVTQQKRRLAVTGQG